jgi:hypothetical protein
MEMPIRNHHNFAFHGQPIESSLASDPLVQIFWDPGFEQKLEMFQGMICFRRPKVELIYDISKIPGLFQFLRK